MRKIVGLLGAIGVSLALTGCAGYLKADPQASDTDLVIQKSTAAADVLAKSLGEYALHGSPVLVASFVEIDDLTKSSTFGRAVSEQVAGRLASHGLPVVELKLRNSAYVSKDGGEFLLSRELKDLTQSHKAQLVVVGTYAVSGSSIMVTLKAVDVTSNRIVAAHSYSVSSTAMWGMVK